MDAVMLARQQLRANEPAAAAAALRAWLAARESEIGRDAPELLVPLALYAVALSRQRAWNQLGEEEKAVLERALRLATEAHGADSDETIPVREALASALSASDMLDEAAMHLYAQVDAKERRACSGLVIAHALNATADVELRRSNWSAALALLDQARTAVATQTDELMDFTIEFGRARALVELGRGAEAAPIATLLQSDASKRWGPRSRMTIAAEELAARALGIDAATGGRAK